MTPSKTQNAWKLIADFLESHANKIVTNLSESAILNEASQTVSAHFAALEMTKEQEKDSRSMAELTQQDD